jgi:hypothetical protein
VDIANDIEGRLRADLLLKKAEVEEEQAEEL